MRISMAQVRPALVDTGQPACLVQILQVREQIAHAANLTAERQRLRTAEEKPALHIAAQRRGKMVVDAGLTGARRPRTAKRGA